MPGLVFIDGNNLWHAMRAFGPLASIGRQQLVVVVERWARRSGKHVTMVFDGPSPGGGLEAQMQIGLVRTVFSGKATADAVLVELIEHVTDAGSVCLVTSDRAILHAARARRCRTHTSVEFVELLSRPPQPGGDGPPTEAKPPAPPASDPDAKVVSPDELEEWLDQLKLSDDNMPPYWQQG